MAQMSYKIWNSGQPISSKISGNIVVKLPSNLFCFMIFSTIHTKQKLISKME
jgi:hypothetical protein